MSRYTRCCVVPFALRGEEINNLIQSLVRQYNQDPNSEWITPVKHLDWEYYFDNAVEYKDFFCDTLEKEGIELYVVNESPYASVGNPAYCIIGTKKKDIEKLKREWKLKTEIEKTCAVQQTL